MSTPKPEATTAFEVVEAVRYRAKTAPDAPFITFTEPPHDRTLTNAQFADRVDEAASRLTTAGFRAGDACIVHTGNTVSLVVLLIAVTSIGGVVVPSIAMSAADELGYVVDHSQARLLITTEELHDIARAATAGTDCSVVIDTDLVPTETDRPHVRLTLGRARAQCPADTGILMYTSGSSGRPKGVLLSRQSIDYTVLGYAEHLRLTASDTVLICMPLFHVNGMMLQLLPAVISGAHIVLAPKFSASRYWAWAQNHGVTIGHLVSGPIRLLLADESTAAPRHMRAMTFGLPLDNAEIADFERRFEVPLLMVWGLTETCCGATLMGLDHRRRGEFQNVGQVLRGWSVKAVDESGHTVPVGCHGELLVGSPGVMTGYHRDADATARTMRDGYVATGDLGYIDQDGYVHFVSRIKDMLKPNGENVAAAEIADTLARHPAVKEVGVFGVDDPIRVERIVAAVVLNPGANISGEDLRKHCATLLAAFKVPSDVQFVEAIPKTSIGKQQVGELKSRYLSEHGL